MNKLLQIGLISAIWATSGFASDYVGGDMIVNGIVNQYTSANVDGTIAVNAGGAFNNNETLTFGEGGGLTVAEGVEMDLDAYKLANTTYNLDVSETYYPAGSIVATTTTNISDISSALSIDNLSNEEWTIQSGPYSQNNDGTYTVATSRVAFDTVPTGLPTKVTYTNDSGVTDGVPNLTAEEFSIEWSIPEEATDKSNDDFIADVIAAANDKGIDKDSGFTQDVKDQLLAEPSAGGTFDNASGELDFTDATGETFSGEVQNGTVVLKEGKTPTLTGLKVTGVIAEYTYGSATSYSAPAVDTNQYIKVSITSKSDTEAEKDCLDRFADDSEITSYTLTKNETPGDDKRITFPGILENTTTLNKTENKLATADLSTILSGYKASDGLSADATINIQLEGDDALTFATGETVESDQVIEFAGDNSKYTGTASFTMATTIGDITTKGITKVIANADNALPVKLGDMSEIDLEIASGANILGGEEITDQEVSVKSLKTEAGTTFTVAAGTTLNIGSVAVDPLA